MFQSVRTAWLHASFQILWPHFCLEKAKEQQSDKRHPLFLDLWHRDTQTRHVSSSDVPLFHPTPSAERAFDARLCRSVPGAQL